MTEFEQEWISPILEVYKKREITDSYSLILGLNPLGQAICRSIYEHRHFETLLILNSPSFAIWNRYPAEAKPPVIPVQGMVSGELMLVFGDVLINEYEWMTDLLFYLKRNVPTRHVFAFQNHDNPICGRAVSKAGERALARMEVPPGSSEYYDGLTAPLISLGGTAELDPVIVFLERDESSDLLLQTDDVTVSQAEVDTAVELLERALDIRLF